MINYPTSLILDNTNNYSTVKTETIVGSDHRNQSNLFSSSLSDKRPLQWIFSRTSFEERSLQGKVPVESSVSKNAPQVRKKIKIKKRTEKKIKKKQNRNGKLKTCIFKVFKKRKKNRRNKIGIKRKYMLPFILGLLAAKSLLIPVALKVLTFLSAKGLMMGFFSTALTSVLSLKGMFDHSHGYPNRKEDTKTQIEIIQVPSKKEDHYFDDDQFYKRGDYVYLW